MPLKRLSYSLATILAIASVMGTIAPTVSAQQAIEDNPVPKLLENLESENVRIASSAARSLGVVFSPGGKGGDEREQATTALIEKLDSPLGADLREESARALGRMRCLRGRSGNGFTNRPPRPRRIRSRL